MRILGVLVASLCGASALAGYRVERVTAEQMPAPKPPEPRFVAPEVEKPKTFDKPVKLSLRDVTLDEARVAACKSLSITLSARRNPGMPDAATSGPPIVYDLDIDATELDQALDQLGRSLKMAVYRNGQDYTLSATDNPGYANARRPVVPQNPVENPDQGPPSARIESSKIFRMIPALDGKQPIERASLQLSVWPGDQGTIGGTEFEVMKAIDEQGRDLLIREVPGRDSRFMMRDLQTRRHPATVNVRSLTPPSKKIATFLAKMIVRPPKAYDRLVVDAFDDKPIEVTMGRMPLELSPPVLTPQGWQLTLRVDKDMQIERGPTSPMFQPDSPDIERMDFRSADGKRMVARSTGASRTVGQWWEMTIIVRPADAPRRVMPPVMTTKPATIPAVEAGPAAPAFPQPVSLTWDVVAEIREVVVPVEAKDIPLP